MMIASKIVKSTLVKSIFSLCYKHRDIQIECFCLKGVYILKWNINQIKIEDIWLKLSLLSLKYFYFKVILYKLLIFIHNSE